MDGELHSPACTEVIYNTNDTILEVASGRLRLWFCPVPVKRSREHYVVSQ